MNPYRERTRQLSVATMAATAAAIESTRDRDELLSSVAGIVATANMTATALADLAVANALTVAHGEVIAPVGVTIPDPTPRLEIAVRTIITDRDGNPVMRLTRLARSEPLEAGQRATTSAMVSHRRRHRLRGWTRDTSTNPCPLCRELADGSVLPPWAHMIRHNGCTCVQSPVI